MTAPALVMIAQGSRDQRVTQVIHHLRQELHEVRPKLNVAVAFLGHGQPSVTQIVGQKARAGVREIVFVPLDFTHAIEPDHRVHLAAQQCRSTFPNVAISVARPVGPEATLLTVLDARLRSVLSTAHILELDGLVLSTATTGDVRGAALLARRARQWSTHHRLPCLTAVADGSGPSVVQAIQGLRAQGRRHIAVGSLFLTADERYENQRELALKYGAVAVSEPLGCAEAVADLVLARYAFAAMDLLDAAEGVQAPATFTEAI